MIHLKSTKKDRFFNILKLAILLLFFVHTLKVNSQEISDKNWTIEKKSNFNLRVAQFLSNDSLNSCESLWLIANCTRKFVFEKLSLPQHLLVLELFDSLLRASSLGNRQTAAFTASITYVNPSDRFADLRDLMDYYECIYSDDTKYYVVNKCKKSQFQPDSNLIQLNNFDAFECYRKIDTTLFLINDTFFLNKQVDSSLICYLNKEQISLCELVDLLKRVYKDSMVYSLFKDPIYEARFVMKLQKKFRNKLNWYWTDEGWQYNNGDSRMRDLWVFAYFCDKKN